MEIMIVDKKRIFIVGAGGSGKDFLRKKFESKGYSFGIYYTSRPKRENEVDGVDYFYTNNINYDILEDENYFIESTIHNESWGYGLSFDEFNTKDVFIVSPKSYVKYSKEQKDKVFKIFLDINEDIRRERLSKRNDADSVERRIQSDNVDINNIDKSEFDLVIKNEDF